MRTLIITVQVPAKPGAKPAAWARAILDSKIGTDSVLDASWLDAKPTTNMDAPNRRRVQSVETCLLCGAPPGVPCRDTRTTGGQSATLRPHRYNVKLTRKGNPPR